MNKQWIPGPLPQSWGSCLRNEAITDHVEVVGGLTEYKLLSPQKLSSGMNVTSCSYFVLHKIFVCLFPWCMYLTPAVDDLISVQSMQLLMTTLFLA